MTTSPRFFRTQRELRAWLERHHATSSELWIGLYRAHARDRGVVYGQALDEALCFGWIDGLRKGIDDDTWTIRFTPRKKGSIWSKINLRHMERLIAAGVVAPAGKRVFDERDTKKAGSTYSFENPTRRLDDDEERLFRKNMAAWAWWSAAAPSYRKTAVHWVHSAKQAETRARRLATLIADSARGERIKPLRGWPSKKRTARKAGS